MRQAIITQVAGAKVSCKAVWLLQLLRPSLRSAVTASLLSPMKNAAAEERRADFLGAPPPAWHRLAETQGPHRHVSRVPGSESRSFAALLADVRTAVLSHREVGVFLPEQCQCFAKRLQSAASQHDGCASAGRERRAHQRACGHDAEQREPNVFDIFIAGAVSAILRLARRPRPKLRLPASWHFLARFRHFSLSAEALNNFGKHLQHTQQTIGAAATQGVFDFTVEIRASGLANIAADHDDVLN